MIIRPKLRVATSSDARDIEEILDANDLIPHGHDWSKIGPYWLVAEHDDTVVGCSQALVGNPLGHIGFVAVLPGYYNSGVGAILWRAAEGLLAKLGCDGYTGMSSNADVLNKFPKRGGVLFGEPVTTLYKRL